MSTGVTAIKRPQNLFLEDGCRLTVSGVAEVAEFDEQAISLQTDRGRLEIRGIGMRITAFDTATGDISVDGDITAMVYLGEQRRQGFLKSLFR